MLSDADELPLLDPGVVGDEAAEDVVAEQVGGPHVGVDAGVPAVSLPCVVDPLEHVGHPADATLRQRHAQTRELVEDGRQQQVDGGELRVHPEECDGDGEVGVGSGDGCAAAAEVQAQRQVGRLGGGKERVPVVAVVRRQPQPVRRFGEGDGPGPLGRGALELGH